MIDSKKLLTKYFRRESTIFLSLMYKVHCLLVFLIMQTVLLSRELLLNVQFLIFA